MCRTSRRSFQISSRHPPRPLPSSSKSRSTPPRSPHGSRRSVRPRRLSAPLPFGTALFVRPPHSSRDPKVARPWHPIAGIPPRPQLAHTAHLSWGSSFFCLASGYPRPTVSSGSRERPLPARSEAPRVEPRRSPSASDCQVAGPVPPSWFVHLGGFLRSAGLGDIAPRCQTRFVAFPPARPAPSARPVTEATFHGEASDRSSLDVPSRALSRDADPSKSILADSQVTSP